MGALRHEIPGVQDDRTTGQRRCSSLRISHNNCRRRPDPDGNGCIHYTFCLINEKTCGNIFAVQREFRDPTAEACIEELKAEEKLAHMDIAEDLAVLAETEPVHV